MLINTIRRGFLLERETVARTDDAELAGTESAAHQFVTAVSVADQNGLKSFVGGKFAFQSQNVSGNEVGDRCRRCRGSHEMTAGKFTCTGHKNSLMFGWMVGMR